MFGFVERSKRFDYFQVLQAVLLCVVLLFREEERRSKIWVGALGTIRTRIPRLLKQKT